MLTKTVAYKTFDDKPAQETLYFNITKTEMYDLLHMIPRFEAWTKRISENKDDLTEVETRDFIDILKIFIKASYGVRSEDGTKFRKSPDILADFLASAVYDAFFMNLFINPVDATDFLTGIMPGGIEEMLAQQAQNNAAFEEARASESTDAPVEITATEPTPPAYILENRDPTPAEFMAMGKDEQLAAFQRKSNG